MRSKPFGGRSLRIELANSGIDNRRILGIEQKYPATVVFKYLGAYTTQQKSVAQSKALASRIERSSSSSSGATLPRTIDSLCLGLRTRIGVDTPMNRWGDEKCHEADADEQRQDRPWLHGDKARPAEDVRPSPCESHRLPAKERSVGSPGRAAVARE